MLWTRDGRILADSLNHFGPLEAEWTDCFDRLGWPFWMTSRLKGPHILLDHEYAQNYYHWLIEVLPRVRILQRLPDLAGLPCLLNVPVQPFHEATLRGVGIEPRRWVVRPRKLLRVESLFYASPTVQEGQPTADVVRWLRETFLPSPPAESTRRLYVSRHGARRDVGNEDELMAILAPLGFESIRPAEMSFEKQVRAFSEAEAVVAPHGAALASIVFSKPGLRLIELFPQDYRADYYRNLASACGHRHGYCVGSRLDDGFRVAPQGIERLLELV